MNQEISSEIWLWQQSEASTSTGPSVYKTDTLPLSYRAPERDQRERETERESRDQRRSEGGGGRERERESQGESRSTAVPFAARILSTGEGMFMALFGKDFSKQ